MQSMSDTIMDEKFNRKWFSRASKKLREMRENQIFTDLALICKGGNIYVHKCVLMATNGFFCNLLDTTIGNSDPCYQIEFKETPVDIFFIVIDALYGDITQLTQSDIDIETIIQILDTSHLIRETRLAKYCMNLLLSQMTLENCVEFWNLSIKYEQKKAEMGVMKFILSQLPQIVQDNKLCDVTAKQMNKFVSYAAESLNVGDQLISLVIEWGKKNEKERLETVVLLLDILDKLAFSVDYVLQLLKDDCFIKNSPQLIARLRSVRSVVSMPRIHELISSPLPPVAIKNATIEAIKSNTSLCLKKNSIPIRPPRSIPTGSISAMRTSVNNLCLSKTMLFNSASVSALSLTSNTTVATSASQMTIPCASPVHSEIACEHNISIQIHFYCVKGVHSTSPISLTRTYLRKEKKWLTVRELKLPFHLSGDWYPLATMSGEHYYFAVSKENNFLVYSEVTSQVLVGPQVASQSRVAGIADGSFVYLWNCESIYQFNVINETWKELAPNRRIVPEGCNLLAVKGKLFFHAVFPPSIYKYNFDKEEWELKKQFKESCNIKSIKCKCCQKECKKKLYFIVNERQLLTYDTEADEWVGKFIPEFASRVPLLMSCDESFIIFGDERNRSKYFIYYPEINKLEILENVYFSMVNMCFVTCDLSLQITNKC